MRDAKDDEWGEQGGPWSRRHLLPSAKLQLAPLLASLCLVVGACNRQVGDDADDTGEATSGDTGESNDCTPAAACSQADTFVSFSSYLHTCAVSDLGELFCWGFDETGAMGFGEFEDGESIIGDDEAPGRVPVDHLPGVTQVTTGITHTCVLDGQDDVWCWGGCYFGCPEDSPLQIGCADAGAQIAVDVGPIVQLAGGSTHSCVLGEGGSLSCWSQLVEPYSVPSTADVTKIAVGDTHACALTSQGSVHCFGVGEFGELGYGNNEPLGTPLRLQPDEFPPEVSIGGDAVDVCAGDALTCAALATGEVRCWGTNDVGQLGWAVDSALRPWGEPIGDDELPDSVAPVDLGGVAVSVSCGYAHACALMDDGGVRCWGNRDHGRLGYDQDVSPEGSTPAQMGEVPVGSSAIALALGELTTCVQTDAGLRCFGAGDLLGYGTDLGFSAVASELPGDVPLSCD